MLLPALTGLYVMQGLPFHLLLLTLPALLREAGARLDMLGLLPLCFLPVALKALWAPWVDGWGGSRRAWILPMQAVGCIGLAALALLRLDGPLWPWLALGTLIAFAGATQDIAADAMAAEGTQTRGRGMANALQGAGQAGGAALGGAVALGVASQYGWPPAALTLAAVALLCTVPVLLLREPARAKPVERPRLWALLRRPEVRRLLLLSACFDVAGGAAQIMAPYLVDSGFSSGQIAWWFATGLLLVMIPCALLAGVLLPILGLGRLLAGAGLAQAVGFAALALVPAGVWAQPALGVLVSALVAPVTVGIYAASMAIAAPGRVATDIALVASAKHVVALLAAGLSAGLAQVVGYGAVFGVAGVMALLGAAWARRLREEL